MGFKVIGLDPAAYDFTGKSDEALAAMNARRVVADGKPGFPCRATLEDAEVGESLILFHYVSHDVETPYRTAYAVFVKESATDNATYHNELPPFWAGRSQSLRAFGVDGMLRTAIIAPPDSIAAAIEELFADDDVTYIHAHNPAYGCFMAQIQRD